MKVLLVCPAPLGERMAGPAIRCWELAHALAERGRDVTLVAPVVERTSGSVRLSTRAAGQVAAADVLLAQQLTLPLIAAARRGGTATVLDAYDPLVLENLHLQGMSAARLRAFQAGIGAMVDLGLVAADAVVCASERQRDLWLGALMALGRVTQEASDADPSLRALIDVVPFGLPAGRPETAGAQAIRDRYGIADGELMVLWGGGVWDWLDPDVVRRGAAQAGVQVVFMGADGWVGYDERQAYLAAADVGVSAHHDHVETRFSFRTRVLDYLWAGLPCVLTQGDAMADLAEEHGFGLTVRAGDAAGWAAAFTLLEDPVAREARRRNACELAERFRWPVVAERLDVMLGHAVARSSGRAPAGAALGPLAALATSSARRLYHRLRT